MNEQEYLASRLPDVLALLERMVAINSFTANAAGVIRLAEASAEAFAPLGLKAEFVPSLNPNFGRHLFLSNQPANFDGPTIALISHLDTVFPAEEEQANDFIWRPVGDKIYGPGTADIKGGTAMIFHVLDALRALHPQVYAAVRWLVCLDASEETLSDDFGHLCIERLPADRTLACLVFEGGTPHASAWPLVIARKGRAEFRVTTHGRGAHAGNYHHLGANAIVQMAHTVQKIAAFTNYDQKITFNPGVISGGSVVNRVPHLAELTVEMRSFDPIVFEAGIVNMLSLNGSCDVRSSEGYPASVTVEVITRSLPWPENPATTRLYEHYARAAADLGMTVAVERRGGLSDANALWQRYPTLDGLGPAGDNAHCSEQSADGSKEQEYILPASFVPKSLLNLHAILKLVEAA